MEYAVIELKGRQYKIKNGDVIDVDNLAKKEGESYSIDKVLLYVKDSEIKIGSPYLSNFKVSASVLKSLSGEKIRVARFKAKSRYRKTTGFRAKLSRVQIKKISQV